MSYARYAKGESDVYVFLCVSGMLECCACSLDPDGWRVDSTEQMLDHLNEHKAAGHLVPDYCIERLREDRENIDRYIAETPAPQDTQTSQEDA